MAEKDNMDISSSYDELGGFDFDVDESGTKRDAVAQPSKIRSDYLPSLKSGFVEGLKRELASKMPHTAAAFDQVTSIYNEAKNMTTQFFTEAAPTVRAIGRSTNRLMPLVRPFMPKKAYDAITGKLSQIPDEQGELSEEERQSQQITADINAAFQGSDANAQIRSNMENVVGGMRHKATMGALSGLLSQMQTTNKFLTTSLMAYLKKDLELQYRQLYVQRDIASTLRGTAKLLDAELKNITHNTGLPESIKAKDFQKRTTKREKMRDYVSGFWKNIMGNLKNNVLEQIKGALEGIEAVSSGAADMAEMQQEMEGKPLNLGNLMLKGAFNLGGRFLGSKITNKVSKLGLQAMNGFDSLFENFQMDAIRGIENYARKDNMLGSFLQMLLPGKPSVDPSIENVLAKNPTKPVAFDISTREAIVSIIPGYLAKIQAAVADMKDPSKSHEELIYSTDERRFVSRSGYEVDSEGVRIVDGTTGKPVRNRVGQEADKIINSLLKPDVYGSHDHLAIISAGTALKGASSTQIKDFFNKKSPEGKSYHELINRFFMNLVRSEDHYLDVEALDAWYWNKDIDRDVSSYITTAIDGLGKDAREIVKFVLDSLKGEDGEYSPTIIRKFQKQLDKMFASYEVNDISEKFSVVMNDLSEEKREAVFDILIKQGIYDRQTGKLDIGKLNEITASQLSEKDLGEAVNQWSSRKAVDDIAASGSDLFSVGGLMTRGLDAANNMAEKVSVAAKDRIDKTRATLSGIKDKTIEKVLEQSYGYARSIMGDDAIEAFKLMKGALIDKYQKSNGVASLALDMALMSGDIKDSDKDAIITFAQKAMKEDDEKKIAEMRLGTIGAIESENLKKVFAEATNGINTKKDAVNHFGDIHERMEMLRQEEVFAKVEDLFKSKLSETKDKVKSKWTAGRSALGRIKEWARGIIETDEEVKGVEKTEESSSEDDTAHVFTTGEKLKEKAKSTAESLKEKFDNAAERVKEHFEGPSVTAENATQIALQISEVLKSGLAEYRTNIAAMDENVARIYGLLEKKLGNLTEEELNQVHEKSQQIKDELKAKEESSKPKSSFGSKAKAFGKGVFGALNPFKSLNAARIAAKYMVTTTPESAFHADFQAYFSYRKEMDVCMATLLNKRGFWGNAIGGTAKGLGTVLGGAAQGLGTAASGLYHGAGHALGGILPALGSIGSGLIQGGATIGSGLIGFGGDMMRIGADMTKGAVKLAARAIVGSGGSRKEPERWYDLYRKDEVGEEGWIKRPILSVRQQKRGIFHVGPEGQSMGKILKTDDIVGPVMDKKGNLLITQEDWDAGIVNVENKTISDKAKEHEKGALIQLGGGKSLLGGLFSGVGSLLGGGLKGAGTVLSKMLGINWDITKMFTKGLGGLWEGTKWAGGKLAGALGIGNSEAAQKKKYSVILGKFDTVIDKLDQMTPKSVTGDTDGDGHVEGSFADSGDEDKAHQKSSATKVDPESGKVKTGNDVSKPTTILGKIFEFLKDPKGALLGMWSGITNVASGIFKIGKFALWTLPKTLLWTLPKWLITVGFPTTWAALGKGLGGLGRFVKGNLGTLLTVAGAGLALYHGTKAIGKLRDENGEITNETVSAAGEDINTARNTDMNLYRVGKTITAVKKAKEADKSIKTAKTLVQMATDMDQLQDAGKMLKDARKAKKAASAAIILPNVATEGSHFAKLVKACKLDKFMAACAGKWAQLKDVAKGFVDGLKKLKSVSAVATWLKNWFGVASKTKPQIWAKYLRFFSFLKGTAKVFMAAINYLLEPAMMAIDGWIRSEVIKAAAELNDTSLIDEYEEQNKFGFGRLVGAVFTGGLSEVYNLSASAMTQASAAVLESANAESSATDAKIMQMKYTHKLAKAAKDKGDHRQAAQLKKFDSAMDSRVDDIEADSSWYNSFSGTRKAERMAKAGNAKSWFQFMNKRLRANKWLMPDIVPEIIDIMIVNFAERKALHPSDDKVKGWGYQINQYIEKISNVGSLKDIQHLFVDKLTKDELLNPEAQSYVIGYLNDKKITVEQILEYAKQVDARVDSPTDTKVKVDGALKEAKKESGKDKPPTPESVEKNKETTKADAKQEKFKQLDAVFSNADTSESVYKNAGTFFNKNIKEPGKWPESGIYEVGDAIFAIINVKRDDSIPGTKYQSNTGLVRGTGMLRVRAYMCDRYDGLDKNFVHLKSRILHQYWDDAKECFHYVAVFKKEQVYTLLESVKSTSEKSKKIEEEKRKTDEVKKEAVKKEKESKKLEKKKSSPKKSSNFPSNLEEYKEALALIYEWKDKPSSPERTGALTKAGVDFVDDPDDINDTIKELQMKIDAAQAKKPSSASPTPAKSPSSQSKKIEEEKRKTEKKKTEKKKPDIIKPKPAPEIKPPQAAAQPKPEKPKAQESAKEYFAPKGKNLTIGDVLIPFEGESRVDYEKRYKTVFEIMKPKHKHVYSYYEEGSKAKIEKKYKKLIDQGVKTPVKAVTTSTVQQKQTPQTPQPESSKKPDTKTPTPQTPVPASMDKETVKDRSKSPTDADKSDAVALRAENKDLAARLAKQQGELDALKAFMTGETPQTKLLRELVGLQTKNNELVDSNGAAQREQFDVFGRRLENAKPTIIPMVANAAQQPPPVKPPSSMIRINQGAAQ